MMNKVAFGTIPRSTHALKEAGHGLVEMRLGGMIAPAPSLRPSRKFAHARPYPVQGSIADMVAPTSSLIKAGNVKEAGY